MRFMRIAMYLAGLESRGGYPEDFQALASALEEHGHAVLRLHGRTWHHVIQSLTRLRRDRPDVLHLIGANRPSNLLIGITARLLRIPMVVSLLVQHTSPIAERGRALPKYIYMHLYVWLIVRHARAIHAFDSWEQSALPPLGARVFLAGMGVPPPGVTPQPRSAGRDVVFFGRNDVYQKGIDLLLDAVAVLQARGDRLPTIRIYGRPHEDSESVISARIAELGIHQCVFLMGPSDDLSPIATARCLVYPSRHDGPPRPPRAAISMGVPVIVTDATSLGDGVLEYGAGWVCTPTVDDLTRALEEMASVEDLGEFEAGAIKLAERWSWGRVAEDYARGYALALGQST